MRQAMEHQMAMRALLCVPVTAVGMIGAALALGTGTASAAVECITEPNREPPEGSHWYYRYDRANDRKCWYLRALIPGTAPAPVPAATAERPRAAVHAAAAPAAQRSKPPLTESDEAALYLEFLRWKEQQRTAQ
jgi:hypothetical protein